MKRIVTATSPVDDVLNGECVHADNTAYLHKLIMSEDSLFFISHPGHFAESLSVNNPAVRKIG